MNKIYSIGDEEELVADMSSICDEKIKETLETIRADIINVRNQAPTSNIRDGLNVTIMIITEHMNDKPLRKELEEIKTEINELDTKFVASESDFIGGDIMVNKDEVLNIINKYIKEN